MRQVLIRNLDDTVLERLKQRAERANVSLEQSLRDLLTAAAREIEKEEALAVLDRIRASSKPTNIDATALIREDRDTNYGRPWPNP